MSAATAETPVKIDDQIDHLDFDIACEIDDCEHAADWWNVCLACGAHHPVCEPHRRSEVLSVETYEVVFCHECRVAVRGRFWRRLFTFVPIGRP